MVFLNTTTTVLRRLSQKDSGILNSAIAEKTGFLHRVVYIKELINIHILARVITYDTNKNKLLFVKIY